MTDLERYLMMQGMNKMALDFSKLMPWIRQTIEQQGLRQGGNTIRTLIRNPQLVAQHLGINLADIGIEAADYAKGRGMASARAILRQLRDVASSGMDEVVGAGYGAFQNIQENIWRQNYRQLSRAAKQPGFLRRAWNATPKWVVGVGAGVGGFGLANMLAQPRIDAARREGFGQATGQLSPLIQGMYGSQGAWRLPPYAQR
jgi:hypothetical protein